MLGDTSSPRASALTNALENSISPHSSTVTSDTVRLDATARLDLDLPYAFRNNLRLFAMSMFVARYSTRMGCECYQVHAVNAIEFPQGPPRNLRHPLLPQWRFDGDPHPVHTLVLADVDA